MKVFEKSLYRRRTGLCFFCSVVVMMALLTTSAEAGKKSLLLGFEKGEDSETIPEGWKHIAYFGKAKNTVSLIGEGKRTVVHIKSLNSISALITNPDADIKQYPVIAWRWKVDRAVGMAIEARRDRNDCAARVRVIFGKDRGNEESFTNPVVKRILETVGFTAPDMEPSGTKIDYIWGNQAEKDEILDHPLAKNHKVVVVEKGNERAGQWIWEKRNLRKDYCQFFGSEPPGILAIAVLTDTDQTNEGVEAYYSNITLMSE